MSVPSTSTTCVFVTDIQITCRGSYNISKELSVDLVSQSINVQYDGSSDHTRRWALKPPVAVSSHDTLKIQLYKRHLGINVKGDFIAIQGADLTRSPLWYPGREVGMCDLLRIPPSYRSDVLHDGPAWTKSYENYSMRIGLQGTGQPVRPVMRRSTLESERTVRGDDESTDPHKNDPSGSSATIRAHLSEDEDEGPALPVSVATEELRATTDEILDICPRFRVLVIGKTGVGKSSLINSTFGVTQASVSEDRPGSSDINFEITSSDNDRFVVHDSRGFEHGETRNLDIVKRFIHERQKRHELKDRLHAIWLCTEIPVAGGRVFERGDEEFLKEEYPHVPVIVIFTKFDLLIRSLDYHLDSSPGAAEERERIISEQAEAVLHEDCVVPLRQLNRDVRYTVVSARPKYHSMLQELVKLTITSVEKLVAEEASLTSGMAQRVNPELKVKHSIEVGKRRYWRGLASSVDFPGFTLKHWLQVIHKDIITIWNFQNPDFYLYSDGFMAQMTTLVDEMADLDTTHRQLTTPVTGFSAVAAVAGVLPASAPVILPVAAAVAFAAWVYQVYQRSHSVLRCLMGYIIDLVLIFKVAFRVTLEECNPTVDRPLIDAVYRRFDKSSEKAQIHGRIRAFVAGLTAFDRLDNHKVLEKITDLIIHTNVDNI